MNTNDIEKILREAPQPRSPAGLRNKLVAAGVAAAAGAKSGGTQTTDARGGFDIGELRTWGRRWWSALIPAGATVLCVGIVVAQQARIRTIEQELQRKTYTEPALAVNTESDASVSGSAAEPTPPASEVEIERLKNLVAGLEREIMALKQATQAGAGAKLAAASGQDFLSPDEVAALNSQRDKAMRTVCSNNLKQFGLAVRIFATDNQETFPPSILSIKDELSTPKILVCPADTGRQAATSWDSFTMANCSYEFLGASASETDVPNRVLSRCSIHSNVGLFDGSVHYAKPDCLVSQDGKLYMMTPSLGAPATKPAGNSRDNLPEGARKRFMERYEVREMPQEPARKSP